MGRMIANKIRGMNWKAKVSLIVVFALVFSTFMHQGWYQPGPASGAIAYGSAGAVVTGTTSLSVPYPAGITAGDLLVLAVANKYPANGPSTPAGWTLAEQRQGGAGGGGGDSGQMYSTVFIRVANGTESGNLTVTLTGANSSVGRMFRYTKAANTGWLYGVTGGSDNNANASWIVNGAADPGITSGDMLVVVSAINSDNYTFNTQEVTAAGATIASGNERQDSGTTTNDDCALVVSDHAVTDGTATAAPQFTMNSSGSGGNAPAGASVILRIREVSPGPVTPNIEYGGYVPSSFTFTTTFSDNIVAVNGCAFTTNGTAWNGGTISGASPTWTCTASPSGLANGTVLTLNMRATTNPATDLRTATAISRTVDALAPTDGIVTVTPGHTKNTLSWSGFSDAASGLRIANTYTLRFLSGGTPPTCTTGTEIYLGTATTFTHTGLTNGTQYSYRVCAFDNVNNRSTGATVSGTPVADSTPPTAGPVSVSIEYGSYVPGAFTLSASFTDNDSNITGCEYATLGTNWAAGTLSGSSPTWTCTQNLSGLANGTALTLNMRATSPGGTGTATSISRTVDAAAPTNGTLTPTAGDGQISLSWSGFSDAASGLRTTNTYTLRFQTGATAPANCTVGTEIYFGTATSYVHTGLTNGTQYSYRVCAYDNVNNLSTGATASPAAYTVTRYGSIVYNDNTTTPKNREYSSATGIFGAASNTLTNQIPAFIVNKYSPTRDERIVGYVRTGATPTLYIMRWNGSAWSNEWNVNIGDNTNGRRFDIAYENLTGNAVVVYSRDNTNPEMIYRVWNGSTWTGATNLDSARVNAVINWIKMESRPNSNEIAVAFSGTDRRLSSFIWNGSAWGNEPGTDLTSGANLSRNATSGDYDTFDLAYESLSGDLMVVWGDANYTDPGYRTYSSGTWSNRTELTNQGRLPAHLDLASDPLTDRIILSYNVNADTRFYGSVWDGSNWSGARRLDNDTGRQSRQPTTNNKEISVAFLNSGATRVGIVAFNDNNTTGNVDIAYTTNDGSSFAWNSFTPTPAQNRQEWMDIQVDPLSVNTMMLTYSDTNSDLFAKRLVINATPTFTWSNADNGAALFANLTDRASQNFSYAWKPCIPQGAQPTMNSPIAPKSGSPISVCGDVNTNGAQNVVYQIANGSGTVLYKSGTCSGISTAGWTAGDTFTLTVTSNNGCGTAFSDAVDTFILYQPPSVVSGPTVSSTATATHVDSPFTITARFNDNSFAITSCQYSTNNGGAWTAAAVSGSGAATDCTTTAAACTNGTAMTILMRATNLGGTTATSSIARTCDTVAPTTTDNQVSSAWQATEKTVTLTPNDGTGSGVAAATGIFGCFGTSCVPAVLGSNSMTTNCGVNNACTYDVRYYSVDSVGNAEAVKTSAFQARIDRQLPTAPTGFSAANSGAGATCNVTWNPNASDGSGSGLHTTSAFVVRYQIGAAPACGAGTVGCTVGSGSTSCSIGGLTNGTGYGFRLCVSDNAGNLTTGATSSCTPSATAVRTVVGDGNSPSSKNAPTSTTNNAVSTFTLSTTSGGDTVTQIIVRIGGSGTPSDVAAGGVKLYRDVNNNNEWDAGDTLLGTTSFVGNEATFTGLGIVVSTTSVQYLITYDIPPTATIGSTLTAYVLSAAGTNPVNNNDNADATLTVILGCNRYNPTVEIFPSFRVLGKGVSTTYSVRVTNNDSTPCGSTIFSLTPTNTPAVPNANFSASTLSSLSTGALAPGSLWTTTLTHTSEAGAATGSTQRTRVTSGATANHGAVQSNEVTSTVAVTAGAGDGTLLKRSAGEMCDSCHKTSNNAPNDPNSIKMHSAEWLGSCSNSAYTSRTSCTTNGGTWTSKWGASGWGISGGQYGEMLCTTCHSSHNTRNIYLIKETISSPNSPTHNFPGSTVDFRQKTGTGVGSMGSTGVYANSTKVCEVCHTQTAAHKEDQPVAYCHEQPAGTDCTTCHSHARGFKTPGNCVVCHSLPQGSRAAVVGQFSQNSHHVQGVTLTDRHCYQCHWEANSDGSINTTYHSGCNTPGSPVNLVIYGAGARPATYTLGTTAVAYTANGTRAEMQKINQVCIGCHDDDTATVQPFGDGKTPSQYAWDGSSVANRYSQAGTTTWGKYTNTTTYPNAATKNVTKAYSAHGNAGSNARGWNTTTGYDSTPPNTSGSVNVLCFDCHNSHGSSVAGTTTSYASSGSNWTKGGILKDTTAGFGGYTVTYRPADNAATNASRVKHSAGADLCFDCHLTPSATGGTPWSYNGTFLSTQIIEGYRGKPGWTGAAGVNPSGAQQRYTYKNKVGSKGSHFEGSSGLGHSNAPATSTINGLCTPCHDPHGVTNNTSRISAVNKQYAVPLLKGTWMTSPYKEDAAPLETNLTTGYSSKNDPQAFRTPYNGRSRPGYAIDQNTFPNTNLSANPPDWLWDISAGHAQPTEPAAQFGGLCLSCHAQADINPSTGSTAWNGFDRIHNTVKGWGGTGANANNAVHAFTCSKCHTPHHSSLPRLMITNCLDYKHRGRVGQGGPLGQSGANSGRDGAGWGRFPGGGGGHGNTPTLNGPYYFGERCPGGTATCADTPTFPELIQCHNVGTAGGTGYPASQLWNTKTPWAAP